MAHPDTNGDATLALAALGWTVGDAERAGRLLALTGLTPVDLRGSADTPATLAAVLNFLEQHEPDLLACAAALDEKPEALVAARRRLENA